MTSGLELHEACSVGDYDTLEDYLKSGKYDVNLKDPEWRDKTPLHWAAGKGNNIHYRISNILSPIPLLSMCMYTSQRHFASSKYQSDLSI